MTKPLAAPVSQPDKDADGFTQGAAWAIAVCHRYNLSPGQMLHECGLKYSDFVAARVVASDLEDIRKVRKLEGIRR